MIASTKLHEVVLYFQRMLNELINLLRSCHGNSHGSPKNVNSIFMYSSINDDTVYLQAFGFLNKMYSSILYGSVIYCLFQQVAHCVVPGVPYHIQ